MIEIIADTDRLVDSRSGEWVVSQIAEYTKAYQRLLEAAYTRDDTRLYVQHSTIVRWFENMAPRYPQGTFRFGAIDAKGWLAELWDVSIPEDITPQEIQAAGLLELEIEPQPGLSFEEILLAYFYDPIFTLKQFPIGKVSELMDAYDSSRWTANAGVQLLAKTYAKRLETWRDGAKNSEQRHLIEQYAADPPLLKDRLMTYRVLKSYPQLGNRLLGEDFHLYKSLGINLQGLTVDERAIEGVVAEVTYALNEFQVSDQDELEALVDSVSGLLMLEFEKVEKTLLEHPVWITSGLVDEVESKFESLSNRIGKRIVRLRGTIRPKKPAAPVANWDVGRMLDWAINEYLPYQAWCDRHDHFERDLYETGDQFSAWLYENWNEIHANSGRMVFNVLPNAAIKLREQGVTNLVLVVDNLGWDFQQILKDLFFEEGFHITTSEAYLAMLPTETEISKKCLLSGQVGYKEIDDKRYKTIIEKGWVPFFEDAQFRYIPDIGGLGEIEEIEAQTYVVNYLAIDRVLHKPASEFGMSHREHIRHLLEKLVENVQEFIQQHNLEEQIRVHVVSDHGSTRIPKSIQNDLDPNYFKSGGFEIKSHRYITMDQSRFAELPSNLEVDCFFLDAVQFGNEGPYLVARRGNRFLKIDGDVYVHGGMLPEEVIVPYMAFETTVEAISDLTVTLIRNEFRYRMETIELEIGNPNEAAVDEIRISALNSNVEMDRYEIDLLMGKRKTKLTCKALFKRTPNVDEQNSLTLRLRYRYRGDTHTQEVQKGITIHRMIEEVDTGIFDLD